MIFILLGSFLLCSFIVNILKVFIAQCLLHSSSLFSLSDSGRVAADYRPGIEMHLEYFLDLSQIHCKKTDIWFLVELPKSHMGDLACNPTLLVIVCLPVIRLIYQNKGVESHFQIIWHSRDLFDFTFHASTSNYYFYCSFH